MYVILTLKQLYDILSERELDLAPIKNGYDIARGFDVHFQPPSLMSKDIVVIAKAGESKLERQFTDNPEEAWSSIYSDKMAYDRANGKIVVSYSTRNLKLNKNLFHDIAVIVSDENKAEAVSRSLKSYNILIYENMGDYREGLPYVFDDDILDEKYEEAPTKTAPKITNEETPVEATRQKSSSQVVDIYIEAGMLYVKYKDGDQKRFSIGGGGGGSSQKVDLSGYYTKEEVDQLIQDAVTGDIDLTNYYTKAETSDLVSTELTSYYTTIQVDAILGDYVTQLDLDDYYTKTETDTLLENVSGLPSGGSAGQVLAKASDTDNDVGWTDIDMYIDGGGASSVYGGTVGIDGGGA